jgi:hypothetical protein
VGRILVILTKLEQDDTPREFTTSGLELGANRSIILAK